MADVTLTYKGATIGELSESGSKTLETAGKYCEADILLEYVKSGGAIPSSITKIDGGEFVLENNTASTKYKIDHNLGVVPKGFIIWCDDLDIAAAAINYSIIYGYFVRVSLSSGTVISYMYQMGGTSTGGTTSYSRNIGSNYATEANDTNICYNVNNCLYVGGERYKWLAWA